MAIHVNAENVAISNPVQFLLQDDSAAHVELIVSISGYPPLAHSFRYGQGTFTGTLPVLAPGVYACAFTIQAFTYQALGSMFNSKLLVNGLTVAAASGIVPPTGSDIGSRQFMLTVY